MQTKNERANPNSTLIKVDGTDKNYQVKSVLEQPMTFQDTVPRLGSSL